MASLNDLKELFKGPKKKHIKRTEKEKEEENINRKEDKEQGKDMLKNHMMSMKEGIRDIRIKQDQIEGQVLETEDKLTKKYDDMANKVGHLQNKLREMEENLNAKKVEREEMVNICKLTYINIFNGRYMSIYEYIYLSIYVLK